MRSLLFLTLLACTADDAEIPIPTGGKADQAEVSVMLSDAPTTFGFECGDDCGVSITLSAPEAMGDSLGLGTLRVRGTEDRESSFDVVLTRKGNGVLTQRLDTLLLNRVEAGKVTLVLTKGDDVPDVKIALAVRSQGRIRYVEGAWPHLIADATALKPWTEPFPQRGNEFTDFSEVSAYRSSWGLGFTINSPVTLPRPDSFEWRWLTLSEHEGRIDALLSDMHCVPRAEGDGHSCQTTRQVRSAGCTLAIDQHDTADFPMLTGVFTCPAELGLANPSFRVRSWVSRQDD